MDISKLSAKLPASVMAELPLVMEKFSINTPLRLAHFLSQCAHESGDFKLTVENLNYSADALLKIFPKYFKSLNEANSYGRKPEMIASKIYGNRMGNGAEVTHDGWKYKGRGYIQLTGKDNYSLFDKVVTEDILSNPDLVSTKYPLASAGFWWNNNKMNLVADKGATDDVVTSVRKRVNGGTIGLDDTKAKFKIYYNLLK